LGAIKSKIDFHEPQLSVAKMLYLKHKLHTT